MKMGIEILFGLKPQRVESRLFRRRKGGISFIVKTGLLKGPLFGWLSRTTYKPRILS